jgi:hypothetical protein
LRYALRGVAQVSPMAAASESAWQPLHFSLVACASETRPGPEGGRAASRTAETFFSEEGVSDADSSPAQAQPLPTLADETARKARGAHEGSEERPTTIEQAMAAYLQEMRACGRSPKTLEGITWV